MPRSEDPADTAQLFSEAVERVWSTASRKLGETLEQFRLASAIVVGDDLEVRLARGDKDLYGFRARLPTEGDDATGEVRNNPDDWALWEVFIPLMEELETAPDSRVPIGPDGVRWLPRCGE
mgnify:CR=1 FL=1